MIAWVNAMMVLGGLLLGCAVAGEVADESPGLRVKAMTFNIRYGIANDGENDWRHRRRLCIDTIQRHGGDFVALQEALDFQNDAIRESLRHYGVFGVGRDDGVSKGEFCTILYDRRRWRVDEQESGTFWLSDTPHRPGSTSCDNPRDAIAPRR